MSYCPGLRGPRCFNVTRIPVADVFRDARVVLAQAPAPPDAAMPDAVSPIANTRPAQRYEELKTALLHPDFAEATRVDGKYHFSTGEKLALCREVFAYFFEKRAYETAAGVAQWNESMENEYQTAFEAWYREKLLAAAPKGLTKTSFALGVDGNVLEEGRRKTACKGAYRQAMALDNMEKAKAIANYCKLNQVERRAPCADAYREVMMRGSLAVAAGIAAYCGWTRDEEKAAIEGIIDNLAASNLNFAVKVAREYGLHHKFQTLLERKKETEIARCNRFVGMIFERHFLNAVEKATNDGDLVRVWALVRCGPSLVRSRDRNFWVNQVGCFLMCSGRQDEARQLNSMEGTQEFTSASEDTCGKLIRDCHWDKTKEQIEAEGRIDVLISLNNLRGALPLAKKWGYKVDEVERLIAAEKEAEAAAAAAEREAARERAAEKKAAAAAAREAEEAEDAAAMTEFSSSVLRGHLDAAERVRKRSWSNEDVRDVVNEAIEKNVSPGLFRREHCDTAKRIYRKYQWLGGIFTVVDTSFIEKPLEGTCKLGRP